MSFRDYLSNDKKAALANLEICRKISDEFEEFLAIFTTAAQSGKLVIDKKNGRATYYCFRVGSLDYNAYYGDFRASI